MTALREPDAVPLPAEAPVAEARLLGSAMSSAAAVAVVQSLAGEHFTPGRHRTVFDAIHALSARGVPVTLETVLDEIGMRDGVGSFLISLGEAAVPDLALPEYVEQVVGAADSRELLRGSQRLQQLTDLPPGDERRGLILAELGRLAAKLGERTDQPDSRRTWRPVDLGPVLDGTYQPVMPTVGARGDGVGLFYPGRLHTAAGESEALKTWFALHACAHEIEQGNAVVYLDFEDDEGGVVGRLLALGTKSEDIRARFAYIRPEDSLTALGNRDDLGKVLGDLRPTLAVLDGVTEAMALHGLELKDNTDVAKFGKMLPRWIADQGSATVALDHVVKDREGRGRYAIGGVHKLNGLNGAAYVLDNRETFGIGRTGKSTVSIAKDRPGQLRRHSLAGSGGLGWFADLVLISHSEQCVTANLFPPIAREGTSLRPTHVMEKIGAALDGNLTGLSKNAIETAVGGKRDVVRLALELLVNEGYVTVARRGASMLHTLAKPFGTAE